MGRLDAHGVQGNEAAERYLLGTLYFKPGFERGVFSHYDLTRMCVPLEVIRRIAEEDQAAAREAAVYR